MQALSRKTTIKGYNGDMAMGRPSNRKRTQFGQNLYEKREAAGLTQAQVAEQLELSQRAYSAWERDPVAILPERLIRLAQILGTTTAELLGEDSTKKQSALPAGRLGQNLEAVSQLSRRQQSKILDVVEAMLAQHSPNAKAS